MFTPNSPTFSLENFEGPLDLLLYLIQKDEIDVCEIVIKKITEQFLETLSSNNEIEIYSELLALTAHLLLMKSQKLVPQENVLQEEIEEDPRIEIIQNLIEYCRFKEAAKALSLKEKQQNAFFPRAAPPFRKELGSGLEEIDIEDLKVIFQEVIAKAVPGPSEIIQDEIWHISDKIEWFTTLTDKASFFDIFSKKKSKQELIVSFLALLEMMKLQELRIVKENETLYIIPYEPRT